MGIFWKSKRNTKNTSDNNITISTNTDIMFQIGQDLGQIKSSVENNNHKLDKVYKTLKDHNRRLEILENERKNNKNNKSYN